MPSATLAQSVPMSDDEAPSTGTVRLATELLQMARVICAHSPGRGGKPLKVVDYLDALLRPIITAEHERVLERVADEQQAKKKKPPKS